MVSRALVDRALEDAACARPEVDPALFFPTSDAQLQEAKQVCAVCPVQLACAAAAERSRVLVPGDGGHALWGVWAGQLWFAGRVVDRYPRPGRRPATERTGAA